MSTPTETPITDRLVYTVLEAAQLLAVSHQTIRARIEDGSLPAYKVGPHRNAPLRIRATDIEALLRPKVELAEPTARDDDENALGPEWQ
ncbi:helix-turn-helix domain-containing protein [Rhodococcus rhodochrous]|uniref:helix-turn-helix domain-containing protein n=1 Tax=Rhodococcus rhodochrous TaxID=1829 RepID=UPI001E3E1D95|nr:helix-turn-helix domain-containing protein [Rhodococcus rhodochrous]MCB8912060.1 helix-turn-helix domain-containing protein [Rhodococcus rhodochrous]